MKYPEIGSEFWEYDSNGIVADHIPEWLKWGKESRFLLSGRTAIDHIIKDVRTYSDPKTVYLPSYCCQTMIRPFEMNGLIVSFYDVYIDSKGGICFKADLDFSPDILVSIDYFGYRTNDNQKLIRHFKEKGSIIIEDCTHSLFCYKPFDSLSDYAFAGFRKWMAIFDGAIVTCINNSFNIPDCTLEHESYLNARNSGMSLKQKYMNGQLLDKESFLLAYRTAEEILRFDFIDYSMSQASFGILYNLDLESIVNVRNRNADLLIHGLNEINGIRLPYQNSESGSCPLFVPILVGNERRDELRNFLIGKQIYCPVHWPVSGSHILRNETEQIYRDELSLVCDQRYSENEMYQIIDEIRNFFQ